MGCVFGKDYRSSPDHEYEKLKLENGYVQKRNGGRPIGEAPGKVFVHQQDNKNVAVVNGDGEKVVSGEGEKVSKGGNALQRVTSRKIGVDELVDGWPKWLVDNIPREVLAGLVPKSADSYDKLAKVGQGTYSNVYKARDRETGKIVALKKVRFDTSEPESVKFMAREITTLQKLDHPNVIKLEGLATSRMQYSLYLVFDCMQSDLSKIICRPGERLTEPQVKFYMQQLLSGLQHCHERGILHRDIKGSNLLIDKHGMLKIADFGLANTFTPKQKRPLTSRVVTLWYRAPELLLGSTDYGVGIDLWSAGCLLAEMFVGKPIMPGRTEVEQLHRIFKLSGSPSEDYWKKMKLQTSFRPPQIYKPSFQEAFRDFPESSFGLLTALLALDPGYRGTAASALQSLFFCSSPLACDLSGLPIIHRGEDEPAYISTAKRHKATKSKKSSRAHRESHVRKNQVAGKSEGDTGSSKEDKNAEANIQGQETGHSSSSISFNSKPMTQERGLYRSLSPVRRSQQQKALPITIGHPNATKNIQNFTLLQASITDIINHNHSGGGSSQYRRSLSTLDFRALDPEKMAKLFELGKSLSMEHDH
ncbi:Serine/threonine-protein kinase [Tripterygium wilfordii]|uniref:Serine/threonine-protein kinase n=1 Tax=Tripterygium wilfordii TaxID=458696 RepID=A0A7J7DZM2_TRIWF|nr:probable serine/threonine-protein kinase At1g54610 isoform X2 [Tripterygium wilfordii]KAF5751825.1 Serine/threonine-protein kinase [Tripterygium wilfordii]